MNSLIKSNENAILSTIVNNQLSKITFENRKYDDSVYDVLLSTSPSKCLYSAEYGTQTWEGGKNERASVKGLDWFFEAA